MQLFYYLNLNTNCVTFTLIISLIAKYETENFDVLKFTSLFFNQKSYVNSKHNYKFSPSNTTHAKVLLG